MKFKKNVLSNLILHILSIIIGFVTSIVVARSLGPENQGTLAYILLIFGIIASYGHLGITSSNSYFMKKSKVDSDVVVNNNISTLLVLSIIYTVVVFIFKGQIFNTHLIDFSIIWVLYAVSLIFTNYFTTIYVIDENIYLYNRYMIITNILKGVLLVVLYIVGYLDILTTSIAYSLIEIIKLILICKDLKLKFKFKISPKIIKDELLYGGPLYLAALLIYLNYRADLFMVKNMLGEVQLGIYSISVHLAELAFIFPSSLITAFEGRLYTCKENDREKITSQTVRISFYITLVVCIVGMMFKPLVQVLYGRAYAPAGVSMVILLIGIIFASIGKVAPAYYYTMGRPNIHLFVSGIVLLINIVCNFFLIPRYGINGAAIASSISYTFYGFIYVFMLHKSGIKVIDLFSINKKDITKIKETILQKRRNKRSK